VFLLIAKGPGWLELSIFDCRLLTDIGTSGHATFSIVNRQSPIANRQSSIVNRQSSIVNQLLAPFCRRYPCKDCNPCRIGWDVQVEIQEAVHQQATASNGGAQPNPASLRSKGVTPISKGQTKKKRQS
jgi:hypothetical protein